PTLPVSPITRSPSSRMRWCVLWRSSTGSSPSLTRPPTPVTTWHGALRGLRSFPTRRSSDLGALGCDDAEPARHVGDDRRACHQGDRKSTRLNSSHVSISYAVFCLKKKKEKNEMCKRCTGGETEPLGSPRWGWTEEQAGWSTQ